MLVISRKNGESVFIGPDIQLLVKNIRGGRVQLCIAAPKELRIVRDDYQVKEVEGIQPVATDGGTEASK